MSTLVIGMMEYPATPSKGIEQRFNHHECGDTRQRLYVKFLGDCYVYHCHNCGTPGRKKALMDVQCCLETLHHKEIRLDESATVTPLPEDYSRNIPQEYRKWLQKYQITEEEIKKYGIGYSTSLDRLILPSGYCATDSICTSWQGRSNTKSPKYITKRGNKTGYSVFSSGKSNELVVVEDVLSAIKVSRVCNAVPLLGSYIKKEALLPMLHNYSRLFIWLDFDKSKTSLTFQKEYSIFIPTTAVITKLDPKEYNEHDIKRTLAIGN